MAILGILLIGWKIYDNYNYTNDTIISEENKTTKEKEENDMIVIHITGEVKKPGIVKIEEGSRVQDIIDKAGGLTDKADITNVNLAYVVEDGTKIKIPSTNDEKTNEQVITEGIGENIINIEDKKDTLVNINSANEAELEELPGIGPSISSRIVEYRNSNGKFKTIEDIKNVTGIGENKFNNIKLFIKVK